MLTENSCYPGEFLISEGNGTISRDEVTIAAAAPALKAGTLLGKITASGKYVAYLNSASDGTEVAAAILYSAAPDSAADQKAVVIARHAEVDAKFLTGLDAPGTVDLKALNILVRNA